MEANNPILLSLGLISEIDRGPIAAYCQAWSRWMDAEENVQRFGSVIKTPKGYPVQSPYVGIANRAMDQMRKFGIEFGIESGGSFTSRFGSERGSGR